MGIYRFVGVDCQVGDVRFDAVGQKAEFTEEAFLDVLRGGGAFVPEEVFSDLGFEQSELDKLSNPWACEEVKPETKESIKRARAWFSLACHEARNPAPERKLAESNLPPLQELVEIQ